MATALKSWLPPEGGNLFQTIKAWAQEAEAEGKEITRLSIGQPQGAALLSARQAAARAVMSEDQKWHEYQDNSFLPHQCWADLVVVLMVGTRLREFDLEYLPIPGIKPMLGLIPLACGSHIGDGISVATTTNPGYPTPRDWCELLRIPVQELTLNPANRFRFSPKEIRPEVRLVMMNYPHNPTGQIATEKWLGEVCAVCQERGIRLFNDAAYISLSHTKISSSLAQVAVDFPGLSWMETVSGSKVIGNGTGWRVGAAVGTPDFINDLKTIKGKTDSGFVAPMAAGFLEALENDWDGIEGHRAVYANRLNVLIRILRNAGMQLAIRPQAGFFSLWKVPAKAFGQPVRDAEHFNQLMIERTGVVGVHFNPSYIRYSVTAPIEELVDEINKAFDRAEVSY